MRDTGYQDDDPWHSWLNLAFGLMCDRCHREIKVDWSHVHDGGNDDFLRQCAAVTRRAQAEGWKHLGGTNFLCRECSATRLAG